MFKTSHLGIVCILVFAFAFLSGEAFSAVTLTRGTIDYRHTDVSMNANYTLAGQGGMITTHYDCYIIENEYIIIKVVPEFGGRVISMVYKPTGHEELWQHPGAPVIEPGTDAFYHDWLMVWGGVYPTFGAPEHGKYWFLPWTDAVVRQAADTVSISLSQVDSIPFRRQAGSQFSEYGASGIRCTFTVTVVSGMTGFFADVKLENPSGETKNTEYWTCTTLAPGSDPQNPHLESNAEFIIPDDTVRIPGRWGGIRAAETSLGGDYFLLNNLLFWKNWASAGIIYAHPKKNFWGTINQDNPDHEAIFRISDNIETYSLKIWTNGRGGLPYFEPWAGISDEFFVFAEFQPGEVKTWREFYTPTLGMQGLTHASERVLCRLETDKAQYNGLQDDSIRVQVRFFVTQPGESVRVVLKLEGGGASHVLYDGEAVPDKDAGNLLAASWPSSQAYNGIHSATAVFYDGRGVALLSAQTPVVCSSCSDVLSVGPGMHTAAVRLRSGSVFSLTGRFMGLANGLERTHLPPGLYFLSVPDNAVHKSVKLSF